MASNNGYINGEFINLYSDDNPILNPAETCYFLITNIHDYHRPLVCKGVIISDKFTDGMNKIYYIKCSEIMENPNIINSFFVGKMYQTISYDFHKDIIKSQKQTYFNTFDESLFIENLFPVESFFVRNTYEKICNLRKEYISIIKKELIKQINDIDSI